MMIRYCVPLTASLVFLASGRAQADDTPMPATAVVPYEAAHSYRPADFPWETDFVPSVGPLQLKLSAGAYHQVDITMQGTALHDAAAQTIGFAGTENAGTLATTVGAEIGVVVKVDVPGYEGEIPLGPFDFTNEDAATFTPYLLPGGAVEAVDVIRDVGPNNLVTYPFVQGPVTGNLILDYKIEANIRFAGEAIELHEQETLAAPFATVSGADEIVSVPLEDDATRYAVLRGAYSSELVLHLLPSVTVGVLGFEHEIGPFDLPIDYPVSESEPVVFAPVALQLAGPPVASGETSGGTGNADPTGTGGDTEGGEDTGDTEGDASLDEATASCGGCRSGSGSFPAALGTVLLGLGLARRRRK